MSVSPPAREVAVGGAREERSRPLVVDLDGSLLATDVLWESFLLLVKTRPLLLAALPFWLLKGKAYLKRQLALRVTLDPALLPFTQELFDFLKEEHRSGRTLILATATDERVAREVAAHCGIFSAVLASDGIMNLDGAAKLEAIRACVGESGAFDYVGNARVDVPLWQAAGCAHLVAPSGRLLRGVRKTCTVDRVFPVAHSRPAQLAKALRLHQWVKNLLIFLPLLLAHRFGEAQLWLQAGLAFLAFGLCASGVYVLNDLLDLSDDRQHPTKRRRPFAAGTLQIKTGLLLVPLLLTGGIGLAALALPLAFTAVLGLYLGLTTAYSVYLKRQPLVDVLVLAGLYTLRIFAGGLAVGVPISQWLVSFSMFFFLSLAFLKRYAELILLQQEARQRSAGRDYAVLDRDLLRGFGTTSGFLSVLVMAFYIRSDEVVVLYQHPQVLWLMLPPLLYWIMRVWFIAHRGKMHDDPVVFPVKDPASYVVAALVAAVVLGAL